MTPDDKQAAVIAAGLTEAQKRYVLATPMQEPSDAGLIAYYAEKGHGNAFAAFARTNRQLFTIMRNCYDTANTYRLSPLGLAVRRILTDTQEADRG